MMHIFALAVIFGLREDAPILIATIVRDAREPHCQIKIMRGSLASLLKIELSVHGGISGDPRDT